MITFLLTDGCVNILFISKRLKFIHRKQKIELNFKIKSHILFIYPLLFFILTKMLLYSVQYNFLKVNN